MRILIVNDDGIHAAGLTVAEGIAAEIAGPNGEVFVVAPLNEQSGVSHAISYNKPTLMRQIASRRWAVDGTPADCVLLGVHHVMQGKPPDLILSGVNIGHNVAEDTVYSGTVGGAIEGSLQNIRSIALSQCYTTQNGAPEDVFDSARKLGVEVVRKILARPAWNSEIFYNVNFPPVPAKAVLGSMDIRQGRRQKVSFSVETRTSPGGKGYFWVVHQADNRAATPQDDCYRMMDGYITITPMRPDLTAFDSFEDESIP